MWLGPHPSPHTFDSYLLCQAWPSSARKLSFKLEQATTIVLNILKFQLNSSSSRNTLNTIPNTYFHYISLLSSDNGLRNCCATKFWDLVPIFSHGRLTSSSASFAGTQANLSSLSMISTYNWLYLTYACPIVLKSQAIWYHLATLYSSTPRPYITLFCMFPSFYLLDKLTPWCIWAP